MFCPKPVSGTQPLPNIAGQPVLIRITRCRTTISVSSLPTRAKRGAAAAECRKAIQLDPKYADPHYNLGILLDDERKRDEAVAQYRAAIALEPRYVSAMNILGRDLAMAGKQSEAIADLRAAIAIDPADGYAYNGLGNLASSAGRRAPGRGCFSIPPGNSSRSALRLGAH
jgi:Flp pilus assembly protein TadD